ncbi:MAG: hypothetical protein Q8L86_02275 [Vicinamibacterales bacterium]|nr:hypothetical protein [Vicinamibacterales bacterium]
MTAPLDDDTLMTQFAEGSLGEFPHRDHVRMAWLYLRRWPLAEAAARFMADLQRFAAAKGAPMLFHATITWAYLVLVHERMHGSEAGTWESFATAHPDLLTWKPSVLDRYYHEATLWSDRARATFVLPDRLAPGA